MVRWPAVDRRSLGLFRIGLAAVLIIDLLFNKWPFALEFYSDSGVLPFEQIAIIVREDPSMWMRQLTLMKFFSTVGSVKFFFGLTFVSYLLLLIGFRSRLFAIVSFILLWSIHQRNWLVVSGPDELMINLLFLSMFLPIGDRFGVEKSKGPDMYRSPGTFLILFFIGMVYFFQAHLKNGNLWEENLAIQYALMESLWTKSRAAFLLENESLNEFLTRATLWIEYAIPLLIFFPYRNSLFRLIGVFCLLGLHWTIFLFLELGLFPILVPVYCFVLLPTAFWKRIPEKWYGWADKLGDIRKWLPKIVIPYGRQVSAALAVILCLLMLYKSRLANTKLEDPYYPEVLVDLDNTTLGRQNWGFYAPNPSVRHGWFRFAGLRHNGEWVDLWSEESFYVDQPIDREHYQHYSSSVFFYKTILYGIYRDVGLNWPKAEMVKWNKEHPGDKVSTVLMYAYLRTIQGPSQQTPIKSGVVASYPSSN